jgi:hypothetical protein
MPASLSLTANVRQRPCPYSNTCRKRGRICAIDGDEWAAKGWQCRPVGVSLDNFTINSGGGGGAWVVVGVAPLIGWLGRNRTAWQTAHQLVV